VFFFCFDLWDNHFEAYLNLGANLFGQPSKKDGL